MRSSSRALLAVVMVGVNAAAAPLVGAAVGNPDSLLAEGTRLYNQKDYAAASEAFLKATRANPKLMPSYLQLARSQLAAHKLPQACYAYRAFLRGQPDATDREKAESELQLCERQLEADEAARKEKDFGAAFADSKARFFSSLDKSDLSGARDALGTMVNGGYLGVDLADLASKLGGAAAAAGDQAYRSALRGELHDQAPVKAGLQALEIASDAGAPVASGEAKVAFLTGMGALLEGRPKEAEQAFSRAGKGDGSGPSPVLWRARALSQVDRRKAVQLLSTELPSDPRTGAAKVAGSLPDAPEQAAAELEKLLFEQKFPGR
ncbi:MAG TPA: hypothetical protein VIG99_09730 [Myxococcaceae bacterium]|jgi:hypothetical protein